jgi:hypothetical protein
MPGCNSAIQAAVTITQFFMTCTVASSQVAKLLGGHVAKWPGGQVARWTGGQVARWPGDQVTRWPGVQGGYIPVCLIPIRYITILYIVLSLKCETIFRVRLG